MYLNDTTDANWKNNNLFTIDSVSGSNEEPSSTQEDYNREYERRREVAIMRAQKIPILQCLCHSLHKYFQG